MFNIGDKVKCIDASIPADKVEYVSEVYLNWVKRDIEYTVRDILGNDDIVPGMLLEELYNYPIPIPLINRVQEPMFKLTRFVKTESAEIVLEKEEIEETINI
jgi:hypothetical protein|tara:strand:+ start:4128 stop:4433 length:306 start_codon:yes stop_codon:yes gene_type:complete